MKKIFKLSLLVTLPLMVLVTTPSFSQTGTGGTTTDMVETDDDDDTDYGWIGLLGLAGLLGLRRNKDHDHRTTTNR